MKVLIVIALLTAGCGDPNIQPTVQRHGPKVPFERVTGNAR